MNNSDMHNELSAINHRRLTDRQTDELIGICKGILFDGIVSYDEANNLYLWFQANPKAMQAWPGKQLYHTLCPMLKNNTLSTNDEERLLILLSNIIGLPSMVNSGSNASSQLPLTDPAPAVFFDRRVFVITGNLKMGARSTVGRIRVSNPPITQSRRFSRRTTPITDCRGSR
ncbi:hypothetical protein [Methylobacter tundripaludum]|uniref:hypothetical protein n=1 Tax=Methylobacter tundripaludum TaxID=173365 RepID=UPI0004DF1B28|nr:hypothetical protein [Methylobacter tundripaludum]